MCLSFTYSSEQVEDVVLRDALRFFHQHFAKIMDRGFVRTNRDLIRYVK